MPGGVVAAGHPESATAGVAALRVGGNAVDAAVGAVLASFAVESPLTGLGAGGYMVVHDRSETTVLDFFVAAPGLDGTARTDELAPVAVVFDPTTSQTFYVGPVSCAVPGTPAGLVEALRRFGSMPLAELVRPAVRLAREGSPVNHQQAYILEILEPIHARLPGTRELYAPAGRTLREGEAFRFEELAVALERFAAEGDAPFYRGELAAALSDFVLAGGGTLGREDLAGYAAIERTPVRVAFRGVEVLTNPPPSAGGALIAYSLEVLEGLGPASGPEQLVAAMDAANAHRASQLGSTTHISVIDADGMCAAVTCSNGSGSGVLVPGTGVILNNMLGEEDLNPRGFHRIPPGTRVPSMMAPTVVLRDGEVVLAVGSAGSNRIRSAVLQTVVRVVEQGMGPQEAIDAARVHAEGGIVQAEPGIDTGALARLEARGVPIVRRAERNLYFGGVQAVARDPASGALSGGGDPRRGGAVAYA
jgi:gamma-glutamyltranspeptidase/glutathione hydrolase